MTKISRTIATGIAGLTATGLVAFACSNKAQQGLELQQGSGQLGASTSVKKLMTARGLTEADVEAALKTYVPTGKRDDYVIFASGGQSG